MIHPIIDEYYNHSPSYTRSSGFAVSKGLVSNAPGPAQTMVSAMTGGDTPASEVTEKTDHVDIVRERLNEVQRQMESA